MPRVYSLVWRNALLQYVVIVVGMYRTKTPVPDGKTGAASDALDAARATGPASTYPSQQRLQLTPKRGVMPGGGPALDCPGHKRKFLDSKAT